MFFQILINWITLDPYFCKMSSDFWRIFIEIPVIYTDLMQILSKLQALSNDMSLGFGLQHCSKNNSSK